MKYEGIAVTGRLTRTFPERQEFSYGGSQFAKRIRQNAFVEMNFSIIEARIMANLALKTGVGEAYLKSKPRSDRSRAETLEIYRQKFERDVTQYLAAKVESSVACLL